MLFDDYLKEQLQDPEFKKEWNKIQQELDQVRKDIEKQTESEKRK